MRAERRWRVDTVLEPFILLLEILILEHKPRPWVVRAFRACVEFCGRVARLARRRVPEPLPVGTASAIAMAMQPPVDRRPMQTPPVFVNNSHWMQWEAARRQHDMDIHFAMRSTMPGYSNALNT
jgi:hypothetical protein